MKTNARLGFAGLAAAMVVDLAISVAEATLFARAAKTDDYASIAKIVSTLSYFWLASMGACALFVVLAGAHARRWSHVAAGAFAFRVLVQVMRLALPFRLDPTTEAIHTASSLVAHLGGIVAFVALGQVIVRSAKAVGSTHGPVLAAAGVGPFVLIHVIGTFNVGFHFLSRGPLSIAVTWLEYVASVAFIAVTVWLAKVIVRADSEASPSSEVQSRSPLAAEWKSVANGITLYLIAVLVRILAALATYGTMMSGQDATASYSSMSDTRTAVINLAVIAGMAAIAAIIGVAMIGAASRFVDVRMYISGAVVCMVLGLGLDVLSTVLTAEALGGSVSAAFTAMDLLPVLGAVGAGLGTITARSLLAAFALVAESLTVPDVPARARSAQAVVTVAGGFAAVIMLAMTAVPGPLLLVVAIFVVPGLLYAAIQLLRVMFAIGGAIRERTAP